VIQAGLELVRRGYEADAEKDGAPEQLVSDAEAVLREVQTGAHREALTPMPEALTQAIERIDAIQTHRTQAGLFTGLPAFDGQIGGLFPGELTILAARTGVGKSALAAQIAYRAGERGRKVYYGTLEMAAWEVAQRVLCSLSGVNARKIRTGQLTAADCRVLTEHSHALARAKIDFDDRPALRLADIRRAASRLTRDGLALAVVDYLQLLTPDDRRIPRYEQVGRLSAGLKQLAREVNVPVLCLCQLNREADTQDRPRLSNLRESGSIEQDADVVLLLHRRYGANDPGTEAELIVAKNRNGETGTFPLKWWPERTMFSDDSDISAGW
jgi:replicative DNA helicase